MEPIVILTHGKASDLDEFTQALADKDMQATVLNTATATLTDILAALAGEDDGGDKKDKKDDKDKDKDDKEPKDDDLGDDKAPKKPKKDKDAVDDDTTPPDTGAPADDSAPADETFEEGFKLASVPIKAVVSERYKHAQLHANFIGVLSEGGGSSRNTVQLDQFSEMVIYEDNGAIHAPLAYGETYHALSVKLVKSTSPTAVLKLSPAAFKRFTK
jgi:hypothetical protein